MKTFLKPLTMAEEQYYLQQYQRGDMEAKNILIERNLRLVAHVVKKYQGTDVELDDLISIVAPLEYTISILLSCSALYVSRIAAVLLP